MAKQTKQAVNKSAFVREFITKHPTANRKAVEEAWLAAGHDGVISSALVSGLRTKLGLTGNQSNQPKANLESAPTTKKSGKSKAAVGKRGTASLEPLHSESNGTTAVLGVHDEPTAHSEDRPTTTSRGVNQGKSAFVREHVQRHPDATYNEINEAWVSAGNEGGISDSLLYKIRSEEGLTGRRGTKGEGAKKGQVKSSSEAVGAPEPMAETSRPLDRRTNRGRGMVEIEEDIDRLMFKLMNVGGMEEIEEELRKLRRRLILRQGE